MNARVFLLVLMTGLFMATWQSDQCATAAALARQNGSESVFAADSRRPTPLFTPEQTFTRRDEATTSGYRLVLARNLTIQLEDEIPSGFYQAVSETGESRRLTVKDGLDSKTSVESGRDVYMARDASDVRWYLIPISRRKAL